MNYHLLLIDGICLLFTFFALKSTALVWPCVCVCVCRRACTLRRLYLVGNPSKLIIISKHDRVDKMSCAPPDLLSDHRPYLWWWTDVALAWTNQSLSVRVGVCRWHTHAHTRKHTSKGICAHPPGHSKHTLKLPFKHGPYISGLFKKYYPYKTWKADSSHNHKWAGTVIIHKGIYSCYLFAGVWVHSFTYVLSFFLWKVMVTVPDKPVFMADEIRGELRSCWGRFISNLANTSYDLYILSCSPISVRI